MLGPDDAGERGRSARVTWDRHAVAWEARIALPVEALHLQRADSGVGPDEDEVAVAGLADDRICLEVCVVAERDPVRSPRSLPGRIDAIRVHVEVAASPRVGEGQHAVVVPVGDQAPADEARALRLAAHDDAIRLPLGVAVGVQALESKLVAAAALVEPADVAAALAGRCDLRNHLVTVARGDR